MSVTVEINGGSRIGVATDWRHKEIIKTIPGAKWDDKQNIWTVPLSWGSCLALRDTFKTELEIGPQLSEWAAARRTRVDRALWLREQTDYDGALDLYPFQRAGVRFINEGERVLIGDDPGSGKTVQAIRGLAALYERGKDVFPVLVVCPNTMKRTWKREFEKWWPGVVVSVVSGSAMKRRKALDTQAHVYVINWESLRAHSRLASYGSVALKRCPECGGQDDRVKPTSCEVHVRELNNMKFGAVIADECHRATNPAAKQTRALKAASGDAAIRVGLSGTPIKNDVTDLWSILNWLAPDEFAAKTRWIDRYVDYMLNAFGAMVVIGIKPHRDAEFRQVVEPYYRRMPKELVLPHLPPIIVEQRWVEMTPKQRKAYAQMRDEMVAELESGAILTVGTPLTKTTRLLQLASSFAEIERVPDPATGLDDVKVTLIDPSSKIDALIDDLDDFGDASIAVMAVSRQLIELLSERLKKKNIEHGLITGAVSEFDRQTHMDNFQEGKTKLILFTAQAGGVGITLNAASVLVRLQRPWSRVDDVQALNRVHRIGSDIHDRILIVDYIAEDTVEERVTEVLDKKDSDFEGVVKDSRLLLSALKGE